MTTFLESYQQSYSYDTGNNLTRLAHQASSSTWHQSINIAPSSNRGNESNSLEQDFDVNGNLLNLVNIGKLNWNYDNTLKQLDKDKQTTEYYVYDYQGNRVRTVIEKQQQPQSSRKYLPFVDITTDNKQQISSTTTHIGTHILLENQQSRYQLSNHLKSSTLELDDSGRIISYEHYYPYGGTAIIAGTEQAEVNKKRYRYTNKERDDESGLYYYGARSLAPWLGRWIRPDPSGTIDGLNLYAYVGNNPLKYIDPTGHVKTISWEQFSEIINAHSEKKLNFLVGDIHNEDKSFQLVNQLVTHIKNIKHLILESVSKEKKMLVDPKENNTSWSALVGVTFPWQADLYSDHYPDATKDRMTAMIKVNKNTGLTMYKNNVPVSTFGSNHWENPIKDLAAIRAASNDHSSIFYVGISHLLLHKDYPPRGHSPLAYPLHHNMEGSRNLAFASYFSVKKDEEAIGYRLLCAKQEIQDYGFWLRDNSDANFETRYTLVFGQENVIKPIFGELPELISYDLSKFGPPTEPKPKAI